MDFCKFYGHDRVQNLPYRNANPTLKAAYRGIKKYDREIIATFTPAEENVLLDWLDREFGKSMQTAGLTDLLDTDGMDLTTSPGFPWNVSYGTKRELVDSKHWEEVKERASNFGNLPTPRFVWTSSLKEEARSIQKLVQHNIRQFSGAPMEALLVGRHLFLQQNEQFYEEHLTTSSAVGMSLYNGGWNRAFTKLARFDRGFALDETEWDASLPPSFLKLVCKLRQRWLRRSVSVDQLKHVLDWSDQFYDEVINSTYVLPGGELIRKHIGNPSGSPNTVVDNTIALCALLMLTFIRKTGGNYVDWTEQVSALLYGDDNTFSVHEDIINKFNGLAVQEVAATLGITVKGDEQSLQPLPVQNLDFLSFGFQKHGNYVLPRYLKPEKLLASLAFRDLRGSPALKLQRALAMRELLYGTAHFDEVSRYIQQLMKKYRPIAGEDFKRVCSLWKSPQEISRLFIPLEGDDPLKL